MTSIPQVSRMLRTLFEEDAIELGKQAGMRQRTMSFTQLAWLLVLGWWKQPTAGPSALARFAGSLGSTLSKQAVDCHLTERTADWLLALLQRAVEYVVCARAISLPLRSKSRCAGMCLQGVCMVPICKKDVGMNLPVSCESKRCPEEACGLLTWDIGP